MLHALLRSVLAISCGFVFFCGAFSPAVAGQIVGWWGGTWSCKIDGRPASMKWIILEPGMNECDERGRNCVRNDSLRWKGGFSDTGSRWVPLTNPRLGDKGGMYFRHADGNQWYLAKPGTNKRTAGWTTWNGHRYPLSCWQ